MLPMSSPRELLPTKKPAPPPPPPSVPGGHVPARGAGGPGQDGLQPRQAVGACKPCVRSPAPARVGPCKPGGCLALRQRAAWMGIARGVSASCGNSLTVAATTDTWQTPNTRQPWQCAQWHGTTAVHHACCALAFVLLHATVAAWACGLRARAGVGMVDGDGGAMRGGGGQVCSLLANTRHFW